MLNTNIAGKIKREKTLVIFLDCFLSLFLSCFLSLRAWFRVGIYLCGFAPSFFRSCYRLLPVTFCDFVILICSFSSSFPASSLLPSFFSILPSLLISFGFSLFMYLSFFRSFFLRFFLSCCASFCLACLLPVHCHCLVWCLFVHLICFDCLLLLV